MMAGCQSETSGGLGADLPPGAVNVPPTSEHREQHAAPPGSTPPDCTQVVPGAAEARLLTRLQYDNTVRDLIGDTTAPAQRFPAENTLLGFGNNADAHRASLLLAEHHLAAAEGVAARAVARGVDALLPCDAGDRSEQCVTRFISEFGSRAYRRPLQPEESQPLLELFRAGSAQWGFDKALELVVQAFLQSPQLLYRTESLSQQSLSDVNAGRVGDGSAVLLDSYQIASRLSYFLWNTMPDAELFAAADAGQLTNADAVRAQADRMLKDERARQTIADFHEQWLGMAQFAGLARVAPGTDVTNGLNASWADSLAQFVQHAFWDEGGNVAALLGSTSVFVDEPLAALYGVEPGQFQDPNRAGILTQPGLMSLLAHADQSAPVQRGKFVREQLLCYQLPPPPPDVDTTPPDPDVNATTRERFRQHSADARCASCHRLLDNVGFGLEAFDHLGRFRADENGIPIDATGNVMDSGDPTLDGAFDGALELSSRLAASPQVAACLATQWFRYSMGRAEQEADVCSLEQVKADFASSGGDFRELLIALATTDAFRFRWWADQDM
jgi:Protein of unknown function (DUF1592)/Protein of unknown function (DUF1588)/Protein of unknown function (DUF1595)/Protein of unknown function (DUF1587)/Protein of unknown function (DUF1585)